MTTEPGKKKSRCCVVLCLQCSRCTSLCLENLSCFQRYCDRATCMSQASTKTFSRLTVPYIPCINKKLNCWPFTRHSQCYTELIDAVHWGSVPSCRHIVIVAIVINYIVPKKNAARKSQAWIILITGTLDQEKSFLYTWKYSIPKFKLKYFYPTFFKLNILLYSPQQLIIDWMIYFWKKYVQIVW